jgi:single-strand DNA-binding protein
MNMFHETTVIGNIGNDPELKYLPTGTAVVNFSIAANEVWNDRNTNERREKVTWYRANAFGKQAETIAKYAKKGAKMFITGTVSASAYTGNDGKPAASLELRVGQFRFLSSNNAANDGGAGEEQQDSGAPSTQQTMDDIPF